MNNQAVAAFIGVLIEEDYNRNFMRIQRKRLRDQLNPFDMPNKAFIQIFRLNKQSTIYLINTIQPHLRIGNNNSIPLVKKVLITLNFLSVGSYQNSVGTSAWLSASQTTVSRSIAEICSTIVEFLLPVWVKFPTANEAITVKHEFLQKYGFRGVLGAVDGTHVEIIAPPVSDLDHPPFVYINRKGKHSINVMLVSDARSRILGCNARFPGSVHDSAVWQTSAIRNHLQIRYENGDHGSHLIGDSGYPLEPWLFTPFLNPQNQQEEAFNNTLTSARNVIERTKGILKGRFRCLSRHRTLIYHPQRAANIIYTCCVLHNIALNAGLNMDEGEIEYPVEENYVNDAVANNRNIFQLGREARAAYIRNNY